MNVCYDDSASMSVAVIVVSVLRAVCIYQTRLNFKGVNVRQPLAFRTIHSYSKTALLSKCVCQSSQDHPATIRKAGCVGVFWIAVVIRRTSSAGRDDSVRVDRRTDSNGELCSVHMAAPLSGTRRQRDRISASLSSEWRICVIQRRERLEREVTVRV